MIKSLQCPNCGKDIRSDDVFCMSCGKRIYEDTEKVNNVLVARPVSEPVSQPFANAPYNPALQQNVSGNLIISYQSEHPRVNMYVTFISTKYRDYYTNGQTRGYNLFPGIHAIVFKIGKRAYRRDVTVYSESQPVIVYASWRRGVARISIVNPQNGYPMM